MSLPPRIGLPLVICSLLVIGSGSSMATSADGVWAETRFRTGCDPGPSHPPPGPDPRIPRSVPADPPEQVALHVDFGGEAQSSVGRYSGSDSTSSTRCGAVLSSVACSAPRSSTRSCRRLPASIPDCSRPRQPSSRRTRSAQPSTNRFWHRRRTPTAGASSVRSTAPG